MLGEELKIFTDQAVREVGRDPDLVQRELFGVEQDDTGKVLDVSLNGGLRMFSAPFDIGELITGKVEIKDLCFMCLSSSHLMTPSA